MEEKDEEFVLRLEENKDRIPKAMYHKKKAVQDGFCNPVELQTFPVKGKQVYLQLYRRRWKENTHENGQIARHDIIKKAESENVFPFLSLPTWAHTWLLTKNTTFTFGKGD